MDKSLPIINFFLAAALLTVLGLSVKTWLKPDYPSRIDADAVSPSKETFQGTGPLSESYPAQLVEGVAKENLFRKERKEYIPPPPPPPPPAAKPQAPPKPKTPAPKIKASAVFLTPNKKIAVLEGAYSVLKSGNKFEEKN